MTELAHRRHSMAQVMHDRIGQLCSLAVATLIVFSGNRVARGLQDQLSALLPVEAEAHAAARAHTT